MIYSPTFTGLPAALRQRTLRDLASSLIDTNAESPLPATERVAVRQILAETLPEFADAMRNVGEFLPAIKRSDD